MKSFFKGNKNIVENDNELFEVNSFKDFVDYSPSPIFRVHEDGTLLYINQAFAKMLSYLSKSTLQNVNLKNNLVVNKEDWNSLVFLLKKNEKLENYPIELLEKEGKIVSKKTDIRNVKNNDGKTLYFEGIIVGNQNNNSNNNELLKELEELKEKEKIASSQVNKANYTKNVKSQYLANMTHEIKTPINSIVGFLTLIEQKLFDSEEELMDFAHNARISADSLLEIINNILDISKIEAGKMELDDIEFDLSQEVTKAKSIALPAGGNDKVKISTEISNKINAKLIGDPLRYRQILINVLSNSVKYTETGSIDILVEIDKVRESNCSIKTIVRDTGSGIPKEQLSILFKPYTQVKTKKWNKKDGSGLGLMICKELVKLLDGEIIIKSKEGKGTIVEFTTLFKTTKDFMLPEKGKEEAKVTTTEEVKAEANVAEKKIEIEEQIEENATDKKTDELKPDNNEPKTSAKEEVNSSDFVEAEHTDVKRILLVEDNPISQKVELRLLKESGYNVEAVSNGFDAIEAVKTNSFNLVLMDVEMAEMDGIESTKRIRALEPPTGKVPIIAVTAHSSMKDREKCLASGMDDYIAKPININFMKMTIDHWLLKEVETSL